MRKLLFFLCLFSFQFIYPQKQKLPYVFGNVSNEEIQMTVYEKDTTANAVVLYEHGNTIVVRRGAEIIRKSTIYRKIKILNKEGENHANVKIYLYDNGKDNPEKVRGIKAFTYNKNQLKLALKKEHIYTNRLDKDVVEVTFTFPDVKAGSVLEYQYDLESPYFFNFKGWTFQSDIPKIYSEFHASIPGFWVYNRHLRGFLKLNKNLANLTRKCFEINGANADCENLTYAMKDIPAFIEEEKYSTAKSNYLSKIKFELSEIRYTDGRIKKFTKTWKDTDRMLKQDQDIGKQLLSPNFFKKLIPDNIYSLNNELEKSKSIYQFIQSYFTVNTDDDYIFRDNKVKSAVKNKIGKVSEINLALTGALQSAGLNASIMLISTRDHGYPTELHPVLTDFNYIATYLKIGNDSYLLDGSDQFLPFNTLPLKALNGMARVIDFKEGSFWHSTSPHVRSFVSTSLDLSLDNNQNLIGTWEEASGGYFAYNKREALVHEKNYIEHIENDKGFIEIEDLTIENKTNLDQTLKESYNVIMHKSDEIGDLIYLNPFISRLDKNPFQLNKRQYPVDFGYKKNIIYKTQIKIPASLKVEALPKNNSYKLPNNGGVFIVSIQNTENFIQIYTKLALNKTKYLPNEYENLKEFFNEIVKTQNSLIILKKI